MGNHLDDLGINQAFRNLNAAWLRDPQSLSDFCYAFGHAVWSTGVCLSTHWLDKAVRPLEKMDDAFMHWINQLAWSSRYGHRELGRWLTEYIARAPDVNPDTRQQAMFWSDQLLAAQTPANFFWTNPKAVRRLLSSNGDNLRQGVSNWLADRQRDDGLPEMTDRSAFTVGEDLAQTPGQIVYRNPLVEIIQYQAQTQATWQVPIVLIQPWINKYYIFDLTPPTSFANYLVRQGFTVFITSWKNPPRGMGHVTFDDYMIEGALKAVSVARDVCQTKQVHAAGYCIGGTLLAALMGWLAHEGKRTPVADATFFASLLDFSDPGDLRVFVNPSTMETIEQMVNDAGVLDRSWLSLTFRLLNAGDLIWRQVINNYYNGDAPPRSEVLFWNSDSTNLPGAMCIFYLRSFYLENRMVRSNALVLGKRAIDLKQVRQPIFVVGASKDHICPWSSTFQTCGLTQGPVRYVLSSEGHITGIVNPPSKWSKKTFWAGAATGRRDAAKWLQRQKPQKGSWWPDWVAWLEPRSGIKVSPPPLGSDSYPPLAPAPGRYVHE